MIFAYQSIEKQQGLRTCNDNKTPIYLTDPTGQNTLDEILKIFVYSEEE